MGEGPEKQRELMATWFETALCSPFPQMYVPPCVRRSSFAHECCGGELLRRGRKLLSHGKPNENAEALELVDSLFTHFPELVVEQLGLSLCRNTIVGDALMRGISGGERKRVTTGETEFGMKHADIWSSFFVVLAYIVGFRLLALVFLRFVNSQKR